MLEFIVGLIAGAIVTWMSMALHYYIIVKPRIDSVDPSKRLLMLNENTVIYLTKKGRENTLVRRLHGPAI